MGGPRGLGDCQVDQPSESSCEGIRSLGDDDADDWESNDVPVSQYHNGVGKTILSSIRKGNDSDDYLGREIALIMASFLSQLSPQKHGRIVQKSAI